MQVDLDDDSTWICTVCETDSARALHIQPLHRKTALNHRFGEAYLDCSGGLRFRGGIRAYLP